MSNQNDHESHSQSVWHTFVRIFFGNLERRIATVTTAASILSVLITAFLVVSPEKIPDFIIYRDTLVVLILVGNGTYWLYQYIDRVTKLESQTKEVEETKTKIEKLRTAQIEQLSSQIRRFHEMVHSCRNVQFQAFQTEPSDLATISIDETELAVFEKICDTVTRQTKDALLDYFKFQGMDLEGDLAITVKLIVPAEDISSFYSPKLTPEQEQNINRKRWVVTVYRDPETWAKKEREAGQRVYDVSANTAFKSIVTHRERSFFCNDLRLNDNYLNETKGWKKWYNATMVVPIRFFDEENDNSFVFGFLAADTLNPKGFKLFDSDNDSFEILAHASDLLANYFLILSLYQYYEELYKNNH